MRIDLRLFSPVVEHEEAAHARRRPFFLPYLPPPATAIREALGLGPVVRFLWIRLSYRSQRAKPVLSNRPLHCTDPPHPRLPLRGDSPISPSVQRALSACGGSAKAQRAVVEAKTPTPDALFLLIGFAPLVMSPQDAFAA